MALRVRVCLERDVPQGRMAAFAVPGVTWPILVTRRAGQIIATAGVCPHEDVSLADGELRGDTLVCPGHGLGFSIVTGQCAHRSQLQLRRYRVTVHAGEVWVDLL